MTSSLSLLREPWRLGGGHARDIRLPGVVKT
jgi:hypothetical protein